MSDLFLDARVLAQASVAPEAPAVGVPGRWLAYGELARTVRQLTASLQARGIGPGDFVLNALPAGIASVTAGLAIQRAGACLVEVSANWGSAALANVAATARPQHAFIQARDGALFTGLDVTWETLWMLDSECSATPALTGGGSLIPLDENGAAREEEHEERPVDRSPDDLALLLFTSASTGNARAVMLTHRNIAANSTSIVSYLTLTAADRVMSILPLSYSYGRSLLQTHLWVGASICFDDRMMYPRLVLEAVGAERCTGFAGVPLTFETLRRRCDPRTVRMPALRYVTQAGGRMAADLRAWGHDVFAPAVFYVMYGQTEATARLAYLPPDRFAAKPDSIGIPIPGVELRVVDDHGLDVDAGVTGELVARGENVCRGYFGAPEATREILKNGWLWTGDLGRRDEDGFFFIVGRKRTMLKVSGHRFSPTEVEERLAQHPDVREVCVVGAPNAVTGEAPWAFVVMDTSVEPSALRRFCAEALPRFKVPSTVVALDALPRNIAGKVCRGELEEQARRASPDQWNENI
jgi:long-chain acyl-CoA synthetase